MDKVLYFIKTNNSRFEKYDSVSSVKNLSIKNWLYVFNTSLCKEDMTKTLPENTDKFGKTDDKLIIRLKSYNLDYCIKNIEAIQCTLPTERERLIKVFLKTQTSIEPVIGQEYFVNCRDLLKILILIFVSIEDVEIVKYDTLYINNNLEYLTFFKKIIHYINIVKENKEFNFTIEKDIFVENIVCLNKYICEYCNKSYNSFSSLNYHKKSAKFCLNLQKEHINTELQIEYRVCEYCEKKFTLKSHLNSHLFACPLKKFNDKYLIKQKEYIEKHEKELDKIKEEFKKEKENLIEKYEKELEEQNKKYIKLKNIVLKIKDEITDKYNSIIEEG